MRLLFLAPLLTGLISVYISRKSQDELAYLTGAVAGISLLLSLMIAPWQFQLLLLVLVFSTIGYFWKNKETGNTLEVQQFQATVQTKVNMMKGQKPAEVIPSSVAVTPTEITDKRKVRKYRGVLMDETPSQTADTPSNLKYRGANVRDSNE
ncbi:hypothetical protein C7H19_20550 [Aphanothece hegewaldii CCALA 016]|uniref:DUF4278 domain-containing protein n=1 Tax=Aphanothece hegewaldii CCALA 016 TaxID=2107694 RepID=A0A2T1LSR5_9CHRO|nr:hypothetical protein [Aphanothece hegewaldii]PSF33088.1 hypothetical protein C7H19_20550 [Aphanothece hegewaldii CCALA 016]